MASSLGRRHDGELVVSHVDPAMAFVVSLAGSSRPGCLPKRTFLPMGKYTKYLGRGKSLEREWSGNIWNIRWSTSPSTTGRINGWGSSPHVRRSWESKETSLGDEHPGLRSGPVHVQQLQMSTPDCFSLVRVQPLSGIFADSDPVSGSAWERNPCQHPMLTSVVDPV